MERNREFLESTRTSVKKWNDCIRIGWDKETEIREKRDYGHREETDKDVQKTKYAKELTEIIGKENKIYECVEVK